MPREDIYAIAKAREHAAEDISKYKWFTGTCVAASVGGCVTGSVVFISSYFFTPEPDIMRFLGKSPRYVEVYTKEYKRKMKSKQSAYSLLGCVGGSIIAMIIW